MSKHGYNFLVLLVLTSIWITGCADTQKGDPSPDSGLLPTVENREPTPQAESPPEIDEVATESVMAESPGEVDELAEQFGGLTLDDFFETSFSALMLRSPETVFIYGLSDFYGMTEVSLDDISDSYLKETYVIKAAVLKVLEGYDLSALSPEDQISYDVYKWYLEDELAGQDFIYHDYPATYFPVTSVHEDLLQFFTELHRVGDVQSAQDYLTRLGQVDTKIDQLIQGLKLRESAGITPPEYAIEWAVYGNLSSFLGSPGRFNPLYTSFKDKMLPMSSIHPDEQAAFLDEAEDIINDEVLPAYQDLKTHLLQMETYPGGDSGVWRLPQGEAYYAHRLSHYTTTDLAADEIHQLGLDELVRIHREMRLMFDMLGYPQEETIAEFYDRVAQDGGHISGNQVLETYRSLISEAEKDLEVAFDISPEADVVVIPDNFGGFYISPSLDGSRPGAFYANVGGSGKEYYAMPTLAYHETVPGHHFQISLVQEMKGLPSFRKGLKFTAYTEGWALYAENLAGELGWYEDDPYGYLGLLQSQAFRAARLVVDTGLHAKGWTFEQAQEFFTENTGFEVGDNVNPQYQIARYLVWPGQSTSYFIGYLKIMELRQRAMDELGEGFDLKEFHRVVLNNGSMPLEVLEKVIDQYIAGKLEL